jgi:hypothetical protein
MRRRVVLITMLLLATESYAGAEAAKDPRIAPPATEVQAAPGGGEMLILDRASRYVTRGGVDDRGRVTVGCGRDESVGQGQHPQGQDHPHAQSENVDRQMTPMRAIGR